MEKRIVYIGDDGGVNVIHPTPEERRDGESDAAFAARIADQDVPAGMVFKVIDVSGVPPAGDIFRHAWRMRKGAIVVDLVAAKEIAHARRRRAREREMAPHDDVIAKQIPGKDAAAAEAERQVIRDKYAAMQAAIDAAKTPDQVKAALTSD